jgi:putative transposase
MAKSKDALDLKISRELPSGPLTITISKDCANRYFVSCLCEVEKTSMPISKNTCGVDMGIKDLFVTDKGYKSGNPKYTDKYAAKLALLQRRLAKKKLGSNNRNKLRLKVAKLHAKIADCRMDALHKASRRLVNENQVVCVESLQVKNMIRNPRLAKHIADASWGEFLRQLEYKAHWAGREIVAIDQWFPSSKRCNSCGHINDNLKLSQRSWECKSCHEKLDRDINAAKNIHAAGLAVRASGVPGSGNKKAA